MGREGVERGRAEPREETDEGLVPWLLRQGLLRGPFLYEDYWSSVFRLRLPGTERREEAGLVSADLFRIGLDRPDLEVPRLRHYLVLFLVGPFLLPFRAFRRLGRYRLSFRSGLADEVLGRLADYELELTPERGRDAGEDGRDARRTVSATLRGEELAGGLLPPREVAGFTSLFYATYKLPLASLSAILLAGLALPALRAGGWLGTALDLWIPVVFPVLAGVLYLMWRDWLTALLGALPVVVARFLFPLLAPGGGGGWGSFAAALGGLFLLYLFIDWFFMPRPVPPTLMLYTDDGPGRPYDREGDAPWWLEGDRYWVWRYLMLTPAELNKFWERDWERVELWIRAAGPEAGRLEWVVTDAHYREIWIPFERLGRPERLERLEERAATALAEGRPGFWLVEADADPVFHTPFLRAVSFVPEEERVPARSVGHLATSFWKHARRDDPDEYTEAVERARLWLGAGLFRDTPEAASGLVARHLLAQPWRWWRYPRGAATRRATSLYGPDETVEPPLAAEPRLQVKGDPPPGAPAAGTRGPDEPTREQEAGR